MFVASLQKGGLQMRDACVYRIYVARGDGLRAWPEDYDDLETAKRVFEREHGEIRWCVVSRVEPAAERPTPVLHAEAAGCYVEWRSLH
jgi:hypothetical protein